MFDRTPEKRYWIQVEIDPLSGQCGGAQYDLSLVDKYTFVRGPNGQVSELVFTYAGVMAPLGLKGEAAQNFHEAWSKYVHLQHVQEERAPSLIQAAGVKLK